MLKNMPVIKMLLQEAYSIHSLWSSMILRFRARYSTGEQPENFLNTWEKYEKLEYPSLEATRLTGTSVSESRDWATRIFSVRI